MEFTDFAAAEQGRLIRAAYLLTGTQQNAEDLVQETLVRCLLKWKKVEQSDNPVAYTQRVMLHVFLNRSQRRWRGEIPSSPLPERPVPDEYATVDIRDELMSTLRSLPARQRAAVVLRHHEGLSERQTGHLLGCSVGNVKSLTARGLQSLRTALADPDAAREA